MPRNKRLSHAEIVGVSKRGALPTGRQARRVSGALFSLSITPLSAGSEAKVAVVVSKKVASKASTRNLLRRRSREVLRPLLPLFKRPLALVFYAKSAARDATFADIKRDIERLMAEIR